MTGAIVGVEISWKLAFGQNLVGTSHTYVYMGMQVVFLSHQLKCALAQLASLFLKEDFHLWYFIIYTLPLTKGKK